MSTENKLIDLLAKEEGNEPFQRSSSTPDCIKVSSSPLLPYREPVFELPSYLERPGAFKRYVMPLNPQKVQEGRSIRSKDLFKNINAASFT